MFIPTVKYNKNGQLKHTKWKIVLLGNLDSYERVSNACFVSAISIVELGFTVSLTVKLRCVLRSGDIKHNFC